MKPLISVIVPIYKVEAYLEDCVNSLLCQTLENIEIILVDDGSPDRCGEMCDAYAAQDKRVQVIHQKNRGLSSARNTGIDVAQADYLMFVDSDDWVEKDFCRIPYQLAIMHNADLVVFQYKETRSPYHLCYEREGLKDEGQLHWLMHHGASVSVWNKLYHRKLFQSICFPVGKLFEDTAVTHLIAHEASCIYYSSRVLYHYRIRPDSIMSRCNKTSYTDIYHLYISRAEALRSWGFHKVSTEVLTLARWIYLIQVGSNDSDGQICRQHFSSMRDYPAFFSWRAKRMLDLLHISPFLFELFCHIFGKRKS